MSNCFRLRVNGIQIAAVALRQIPGSDDHEVLMTDPVYGKFAITPACKIQIIDLSIPKDLRLWRPISYRKMVEVVLEV